MKNSRVVLLCLFAGIVLTITSVGCGGARTFTPLTSVAPTSNPLVAQYNIVYSQQASSAWVEFGPDTNYGRQTSVVTDPVTAPDGQLMLNVLVAGMKPQTLYHMRAHITSANGSFVDQDHTFTTSALPATPVPPSVTVVSNPVPGNAPAPGIELLALVSQNGTNVMSAAATDLQGNLIWSCPGIAFPVKLMSNGHFILNHDTDIQEVDLACNQVRDFSLTQLSPLLQAKGYSFAALNNFSHDVLVLPNGHWITILQATQNYTGLTGYTGDIAVMGDLVLDIDTTGNLAWVWSAFDHMDLNRHLFGLPDWTHGNALAYTPDGNLLLSLRNQSWILKLDYQDGAGSGDILWTLGEDGNFSISGGDPSQWFYAQHFPSIVSTTGSQTTLAVFDDGNLRVDSNSVSCGSSSSAPPCYTRATIFQIDESTNLATLLWQDSPGYFTPWGGSIGVLSNGNVEFDMSQPFTTTATASLIMEVSQTDTPQTVWQMTVNGENAYRGYRIPSLYPGVTWQQ